MERRAEKIRMPILFPVVFALLILLTATIVYNFMIEREHIDDNVLKTLESVEFLFLQELHI